MIKLLIVDDHHLFAEGLKSMFKAKDGIEVVCHTTNGNEVPPILENTRVDLILMDMDMPSMSGVATMELLKSRGYDQPVLMLAMHQSLKHIKDALGKGAQGYILKDASKSELVEAIVNTSQRKNYFHPRINDQVFDYLRGKKASKIGVKDLSEREKEIIRCLASGKNSKAISETLFISEHTVKTHRRNVMYKLGVKTSAELIHLAMEKGII
jgi:DNA-binding NarL/FixJ family response regulator